MAVVDILNSTGEKVSQIDLKDDIYNVPVKSSVLHEVVTMQLAGRRAGSDPVRPANAAPRPQSPPCRSATPTGHGAMVTAIRSITRTGMKIPSQRAAAWSNSPTHLSWPATRRR